MARRSSNLPLLLGALLSLVVHLGAIPAFSLLRLASPTHTEERAAVREKSDDAPAETPLAESHPEKPAKLAARETPAKPERVDAVPAPKVAMAPAVRETPVVPGAARPREMIDPEKPRPTGKTAAPEPDENVVKLGRDNGLPITTVAWIAYDDFQTLIARKARTEQPALQKNANPVPVGGIEFDAADAPSPEKRRAPNDAGGGGALKVEGDGKPRSVASSDAAARPAARPVQTPTAPPVVVKPVEPRVAAATPPRVEPVAAPQTEAKPAPPEPVMPRPSPEQLAAAIPRPPATPTIEVPKPPAPATPQPANPAPQPAPQPTPKPSQPSAPTASPQQPVTPSAPTPVPGPPGAPGANPAASAEGVSKPVMPDAHKPAATDGKGLGADAKSEPGTPNGPPGSGGGSGAGNKNADLPPTAAPRSDRESPPSSLTDGGAKLRPGAVLTGDGIEIKTAVPRLSAVAQASVIPSNPQVKVVFDKSGNVIDAAVLTSSGSANFDGPILASLYKWKAAGRKLQEVQGNLTLKITIILVD